MTLRLSFVRRAAAVVALMGVGIGTFEPAIGLVRDGAIHHEGTIEAAAHAMTEHGDHGHEDGTSSPDTHGPEHEHGTSLDHCTHAHGPAVAVAPDLPAVPMRIADLVGLDPSLSAQTTPETPRDPPRA